MCELNRGWHERCGNACGERCKRREQMNLLMQRRDRGCAVSLACGATQHLTDLTGSTLSSISCERPFMQRMLLWPHRDASRGIFSTQTASCMDFASSTVLPRIRRIATRPHLRRHAGTALASRSSWEALYSKRVRQRWRHLPPVMKQERCTLHLGRPASLRVHTDSNGARDMLT